VIIIPQWTLLFFNYFLLSLWRTRPWTQFSFSSLFSTSLFHLFFLQLLFLNCFESRINFIIYCRLSEHLQYLISLKSIHEYIESFIDKLLFLFDYQFLKISELINTECFINELCHSIIIEEDQLTINTSDSMNKILFCQIWNSLYIHLLMRRVDSFDILSCLDFNFTLWNCILIFKLLDLSNIL